MKRIGFGFFLVVLLAVTAFSQQEPQFSHNMFNNMAINPGFAGSNESICLTGLMRQQWFGLKDPDGNNVAPKTMLFSMDAPIRLIHGGLGGTIYQDELGYEKNIAVRIGYAYRFNLGSGTMGIGANLGLLNKTIDFSKFKPIDEDDPLLISKAEESAMITDFGFGLFYRVPDKYFAGLSMIQMTGANSDIGTGSVTLQRHYFLTAGYELQLPDFPEFAVVPSFLIKSDGVATQYDLNARLIYNNNYWGGVTYRVQDAVAILLGMNYKNFKVGYAYDITTSRLARAGSGGSHELMIGYCFKIIIEKPRKSYRNTRFL